MSEKSRRVDRLGETDEQSHGESCRFAMDAAEKGLIEIVEFDRHWAKLLGRAARGKSLIGCRAVEGNLP